MIIEPVMLAFRFEFQYHRRNEASHSVIHPIRD